MTDLSGVSTHDSNTVIPLAGHPYSASLYMVVTVVLTVTTVMTVIMTLMTIVIVAMMMCFLPTACY